MSFFKSLFATKPDVCIATIEAELKEHTALLARIANRQPSTRM